MPICNGNDSFTLDCKGLGSRSADPVMVRGFISFERGALPNGSCLVVLDAGKRPCAADIVPTARWDDGSIRCLAIKASVQARLSDRKIELLQDRRASARDVRGIECSAKSAEGAFEIDTGRVIMKMSPVSTGFIQEMKTTKRAIVYGEGALELDIHINGSVYKAYPPRTVLLRKGCCEAEVIVTGCSFSRFEGRGPSYELHLYLHADSPLIHCSLKIDGGRMEGSSEGVFLRIRPRCVGRKPCVKVVQGSNGRAVLLGTNKKVKLISKSSGVFSFCGKKEQLLPLDGLTAMILRGHSASIGVGCSMFGRLYPWNLSYEPGPELRISLLSDSFLWEEGLCFEREFTLICRCASAFKSLPSGMEGPARSAGFALSSDFRNRSVLFTEFGTHPPDDSLYRLYIAVTDELRSRLEGEQDQWDGFRDFGDYRLWHGQYANCEYDPAFGFLNRFLVNGDAGDLAMAETMLKHWIRFDCSGPADHETPNGLPWVHGKDHRSGEIEPGHMWVDGLLLFCLLTGENRFREAAAAIGSYLAEYAPGPGVRTNERSESWRLMALTALVRAGEPGLEQAMDSSAARLRARQSERGYFRYHEEEREEGACWVANTWVTAGITMEALFRHFVLTMDDRSFESVLRASDWLMNDCVDPISGNWFQNMFYEKENPSLPLERKGRVREENGAFIALGLVRAGSLSKDEKTLNLARRVLMESLHEVRAHQDEYAGRALSVLLRTSLDVVLATQGAGQLR